MGGSVAQPCADSGAVGLPAESSAGQQQHSSVQPRALLSCPSCSSSVTVRPELCAGRHTTKPVTKDAPQKGHGVGSN